MKKTKMLLVLALAAVLLLALAACDKKDEGGAKDDKQQEETGGKKDEKADSDTVKYEGESVEVTLDDVVIVKYPASFKVDEVWSGDYNVCLEKEGEKWEVTVGVYKYDESYPDFEAILKDNKAIFGDGVKPASLAGKEGITYKAPSAIQYLAPFNDEKYIVFACKSQPNEQAEDFASAFKTAEVQYILENIQIK